MDRRRIVKQSLKYNSNITISSTIDELEVELRINIIHSVQHAPYT
jgi:hypothetical protein